MNRLTKISTAMLGCLFSFSIFAHSVISSEPCFSAGLSKPQLLALVESGDVLDDKRIAHLLPNIHYCLADSNPKIRDDFAYNRLSKWMREQKLTEQQVLGLYHQLMTDIAQQRQDESGVYLPFAVLVMSEVARVDRVSPYLNNSQRQQMIDVITGYLAKLNDYRGYEQNIGWRHGVAHAADWILQLALNKKLAAQQLELLSQLVAEQVNPNVLHFYHYGEPQRLARATAYLMLRAELDSDYWLQWLTKVAAPQPMTSWQQAFKSQQGLAQQHNTRQFLNELAVMFANQSNKRLSAIYQGLLTVRKEAGI